MPKVPPLNFRREDIPDLSTGERTERLLRGLNSFGAEAETLLNGGLTFKENVRSFTKELTFTAADPWIAPTFENSWVNFADVTQTAGYRQVGDRVELRGVIKSGSLAAAAFTLPAGYCPEAYRYFATYGSGGTLATVRVETSGAVIPVSGNTAAVGLDGVAFDVTGLPAPNPVFPIRIKNELAQKPTHVLVSGAWVVESGTETPVSLGSVAWTESKGQVVIHGLGNVFHGKKHRVTILVVAE